MAQLNWTYYSLTGIPYSIDMYHGDESGHLMLLVNSEIMIIDFNRKEKHSYSFYIESQLLEFEIEQEGEGYDYKLSPQAPDCSHIPEEKYFGEHFWIPLIILIIALNFVFHFIVNASN